MATYNGNGVYFAIDGTNVSAYFVDIELTPSIEAVDTTAGASQTYMERAEGLRQYELSATLTYDDSTLSTYIQRLRPGLHTVEIGPEGTTSGKPRHVQSMLFTEAPFAVAVAKDMVTFSISAEGAATPTTDIMAGGVY